MDYSLLGSSVHGILQSRIWSGLPFPSPRDRLNTGIKPRSPALQANSLQSEPPGSPISMVIYYSLVKFYCRDLDIIRQKLAVNWVYFVKMNKELKVYESESEVAQLCPTHFDPMDCSSPGKGTGVGCHFLLQRVFLTHRPNPGVLHYRQMLYNLSHLYEM